jgi:SNF2 family DNA or RNA helicase
MGGRQVRVRLTIKSEEEPTPPEPTVPASKPGRKPAPVEREKPQPTKKTAPQPEIETNSGTDTLLNLADQASGLASWAKGQALERLLLSKLAVDRQEKVIIFTHFRATLDLLTDLLLRMGVDVVVYHGQLSREDKDRAIHRFEQSAQVLLSTEAAGEGRNLQFCRLMVNFDLPWNPMRIEQRIGRLQRIVDRDASPCASSATRRGGSSSSGGCR